MHRLSPIPVFATLAAATAGLLLLSLLLGSADFGPGEVWRAVTSPQPTLARDILTLFEEINQTGTTVLFATHDHSLLQARPHRLLVLEDGRLTEAREGLSNWSSRVKRVTA